MGARVSSELDVKIVATIREIVHELEKEIAHGSFTTLADLTKAQGQLFGLERALHIIHHIVAESGDEE